MPRRFTVKKTIVVRPSDVRFGGETRINSAFLDW